MLYTEKQAGVNIVYSVEGTVGQTIAFVVFRLWSVAKALRLQARQCLGFCPFFPLSYRF